MSSEVKRNIAAATERLNTLFRNEPSFENISAKCEKFEFYSSQFSLINVTDIFERTFPMHLRTIAARL